MQKLSNLIETNNKSKSKPNLNDYIKFNNYYDDAIIWDYYGYWLDNKHRPSWFNTTYVEKAKCFANNLISPTVELWYETFFKNDAYCCKWLIYDSANKILYWQCTVGSCHTENRAIAYVEKNYYEYKKLYSDIIESLLTYKKTGIPCRPNWNNNKSDSFGYKNGIKSYVPKQNEIETTFLNVKEAMRKTSDCNNLWWENENVLKFINIGVQNNWLRRISVSQVEWKINII